MLGETRSEAELGGPRSPQRPGRSPVLVLAVLGTLVVALGVTLFVLVRQSAVPDAPPPSVRPTETHASAPVDRPADVAPPTPVPSPTPAPAPTPAPTPTQVPPKLADEPPPDGVEAKRPDMGEAIKQLDLRQNHRKGFRVGKRTPPIAPPPKPLDDDPALTKP